MNQSPPDFDAIAYDPFDRPTPDWFGGTEMPLYRVVMPLYRVVDARVFDLVRILVYQFGPPAGTLCLVAAVHPDTIEVAWGQGYWKSDRVAPIYPHCGGALQTAGFEVVVSRDELRTMTLDQISFLYGIPRVDIDNAASRLW